jgi:hypothetical protein
LACGVALYKQLIVLLESRPLSSSWQFSFLVVKHTSPEFAEDKREREKKYQSVRLAAIQIVSQSAILFVRF